MTRYAQGYTGTDTKGKETVSGDSTIVDQPKEVSMTNPSPNTAPKKIITGIVVGGVLGGGIFYLVNKKYMVSAAIIGAFVGAWAYNKYQK